METPRFKYDDLTVMASGDHSVYELASMFGVSEYEIKETLENYGIASRIKRYTHWTKEEDARLIKLRDEGVPLKEIGHRLRRSKSMVSARIGVLKLEPRRPKNIVWTIKEDEAIIVGRAMGLLFKDIAESLGKNKNTVAGRYYRLLKGDDDNS